MPKIPVLTGRKILYFLLWASSVYWNVLFDGEISGEIGPIKRSSNEDGRPSVLIINYFDLNVCEPARYNEH